MKRLKGHLLILLLSLVCFTSLSAQTDAERKFLASADSLNTLLFDAYTGKDYPAAEALCQQIIDLYDAHATQLAEGYAYFKYSSYYNMASIQAIQGKKQEAASSLLKALDSGKIEVSYNRITNDEDLKDILDAPELQPALKRLKETTDYLYILQNAPEYTRTQSVDSLPRIVYAQADEPDLKRVRDYFRLDSVAVAGDELGTIKRILTYIHNKIRHDGRLSVRVHGQEPVLSGKLDALRVQYGKRPREPYQPHLSATHRLRQRPTEPGELFCQRRPVLLAGSLVRGITFVK